MSKEEKGTKAKRIDENIFLKRTSIFKKKKK